MSGEPEAATGKRAGLSNGTPAVAAQEVTQLLADWSQGDQAALEKLTPLVYEELRRLAHHYMERQPPGHTLQTTALVNEAYLRLAEQSRPSFTNRSHFLAVGAPKTRRRRGQSRTRRSSADLARTANRDSRPQRRSGETSNARPQKGSRSGA
jgi:RNA polymerase sigma factor (TIGR02999 family)